jgi:ketosteroid isomerase-like protein
MTIPLPAPLDSYVEASNDQDAERLMSLFADDAVINDEGKEFRGLEGVRAWRAQGEQAYTCTVEPLRFTERDGQTVLTAKVEGDFPGSPVKLDLGFAIRNGRITELEIHS